MNEELRARLRKEALEMIRDPDTWPHQEVLCLKRYPAGGGFPECGFIGRDKPLRVILGNIWGIAGGEEPDGEINYLSAEGLLDAGWEVD